MLKKILIIDDDVDLSKEMAEILRDEGYTVEICLFSPDGLSKFIPQNYDIIILDFKMPGLNGADILKAIPKSDSGPKVFIISGKPFVEKVLREQNLLCQVAGVIQKPFPIQGLLDKINSL